jgi:hypothetical protein
MLSLGEPDDVRSNTAIREVQSLDRLFGSVENCPECKFHRLEMWFDQLSI